MIEYENLRESNEMLFKDYQEAFKDFLESGWYVLGENVRSFEERFASYCESSYAVGVASGLDALTLSLKTLDLPKDSEVIVPSNTYIATILSILSCGLKPVLVEPDITTYNIAPELIEEKISDKTKAIMIVHLYGKPCEMDQINDICKKHNLHLIEDCAQAHGATYNDKRVGSFGDFGAFSFYPTKNLGGFGDGGAITTSNEDYKNKLMQLRNYGSEKKYHFSDIGMNSRLDELQAALLFIKLKNLNKINEHKRMLAKIYDENLDSKFIKPIFSPNMNEVFHIYNIRHEKRDELQEYLLKNEIKTDIHYPIAPHRQKCMDGVIEGDYPISEEIHKTTLSLPISYFHMPKDIEKVCELLNSF